MARSIYAPSAYRYFDYKAPDVTRPMESEVDSFTVESVIRGYHIYEEVWSSVIVIGGVLVCRRDT